MNDKLKFLTPFEIKKLEEQALGFFLPDISILADKLKEKALKEKIEKIEKEEALENERKI